MELELEKTARGLKVSGEMTVYAAATLKPALLAELIAERDGIELDLSLVREFDTSGLQLLLLLQRESRVLNRKLQLTGCSPAVRGVLELCCQKSLLEAIQGAAS
ncbi:MAG TPA: STAS domain-containing protein [Steroidobacteraceae bacterium]|nr:STAS domain-containing protein [Steroidobacteraceae bacterium]